MFWKMPDLPEIPDFKRISVILYDIKDPKYLNMQKYSRHSYVKDT